MTATQDLGGDTDAHDGEAAETGGIASGSYRTTERLIRWSMRLAHLGYLLPRIIEEIPYLLYTDELADATMTRYFESHVVDYSAARHQRAGLFPFEAQMIDAYFPPPPARIMLPAAGTGRELIVLRERGYEVDASEPVRWMAEYANQSIPGADVRRASLQEFLAHSNDAYDAILTGWAMWTHVIRRSERIDLLRQLHARTRGPLLLSFARRDALSYAFDDAPPPPLPPAEDRGSNALQRMTRGFIRCRVLRRRPLERGTVLHDGMFKHLFLEAEMLEEAHASGWRVAHYSPDITQYGHAVLFPADTP